MKRSDCICGNAQVGGGAGCWAREGRGVWSDAGVRLRVERRERRWKSEKFPTIARLKTALSCFSDCGRSNVDVTLVWMRLF